MPSKRYYQKVLNTVPNIKGTLKSQEKKLLRIYEEIQKQINE